MGSSLVRLLASRAKQWLEGPGWAFPVVHSCNLLTKSSALHAGDATSSQDLEFIVANKVARIINAAAREVPNSWERAGIRYLSYSWPQSGNCIVFDESNSVLDEVFSFIEEGLIAGEGVLLHSFRGNSRAVFVSCMYMMLKYRW